MFHWVIEWSFLYIFILHGNSGPYLFYISVPRRVSRGTEERTPHNPTRQWCDVTQHGGTLSQDQSSELAKWLIWGIHNCHFFGQVWSPFPFSRVPQAFVSGLPHGVTAPCAQCCSTALQGTQALPHPTLAITSFGPESCCKSNDLMRSGPNTYPVTLPWQEERKKHLTLKFSPSTSRAVSILLSKPAFCITR